MAREEKFEAMKHGVLRASIEALIVSIDSKYGIKEAACFARVIPVWLAIGVEAGGQASLAGQIGLQGQQSRSVGNSARHTFSRFGPACGHQTMSAFRKSRSWRDE